MYVQTKNKIGMHLYAILQGRKNRPTHLKMQTLAYLDDTFADMNACILVAWISYKVFHIFRIPIHTSRNLKEFLSSYFHVISVYKTEKLYSECETLNRIPAESDKWTCRKNKKEVLRWI